ncbi:NAC domain-containing protein 35 [Syzygium oleosum]|uniref:NAC domain-containing protein 35 n=1 Tax=Syzygium oleosum TaxID=219896 RepID=UPI0011D23C87|nr:NAC domain-containing protein 35 [Syzygium oleosum]
MAIAATMSHEDTSDTINDNTKDDHEHDMVMPGFRFHPTEEELVEFYLRRKVEGKRFNVELITFLDLYRYDPWELPALAAIGEKEWFFYVPRDRKYRNGDRPNRVTTSGYWKATGADRMIRGENSRSIGLKKTLVFYSGKAPKGIRTSWIMNEYRLPQHETERYQKAEISLCRVYKRSGVEDHPSLPRTLPTRASSSSSSRSTGLISSSDQNKHHHNMTISGHSLHLQANAIERFQAFMGGGGGGGQLSSQSPQNNDQADGSSSSDVTTTLGLSKHNVSNAYYPIPPISAAAQLALMEEDGIANFHHHHHLSKQAATPSSCSLVFPHLFPSSSSTNAVDDLHRLVNYQQAAAASINQQQQQHPQLQQYYPPQYSQLQGLLLPQSSSSSSLSQNLTLNKLPSPLQTPFSDRLWEWNPVPDANREYNNNNTTPFK